MLPVIRHRLATPALAATLSPASTSNPSANALILMSSHGLLPATSVGMVDSGCEPSPMAGDGMAGRDLSPPGMGSPSTHMLLHSSAPWGVC